MLARSALHYNQVFDSLKDPPFQSFSFRLVEVELNSCLNATGTKGFFYKSELLVTSATLPLAKATTTLSPATTASSSSEDDNMSLVTNDNDNLTLPPLGVTNPSPWVDIELEVI